MIYAPGINKILTSRPVSGRHMALWRGSFVVGLILMQPKAFNTSNRPLRSLLFNKFPRTCETDMVFHRRAGLIWKSHLSLKAPGVWRVRQTCPPKSAGNWKQYCYADTIFYGTPSKCPVSLLTTFHQGDYLLIFDTFEEAKFIKVSPNNKVFTWCCFLWDIWKNIRQELDKSTK